MVGCVRRSRPFSIPRCTRLGPRHKNRVRRTSLSCRFHPVDSYLDDEIRGLREWHAAPPPLYGSQKWIATGLGRLHALLAALADLLFLPQAQEPLRRRGHSPWTDRLLDDFLRLADTHGSFRTALAELKSYQSDTQVALRHNDEPRLASVIRAQRRAEKELIRLAAGIRDVGRSRAMAEEEEEDGGEAEIAGIMRKVTVAAVAASGAVMVGVAAVSGAATEAAAGGTGRQACGTAACGTGRQTWVAAVLRWSARARAMIKEWEEGRERERERSKGVAWRSVALDKMGKLEECIDALESSSEKVFRTLVDTRVSLLNILTPTF